MATMRCASCATVQGVYLGRGSKLADVPCTKCGQSGMLERADKGQTRGKQVQMVRERKPKPEKKPRGLGAHKPIDKGAGLWGGLSRPTENWKARRYKERQLIESRIVRSANGWRIETKHDRIVKRSEEFGTRQEAERAISSKEKKAAA